MNYFRLPLYCTWLLLLIGLVATCAVADTPGTCPNTAADCTQTCNPQPGHDCVILVQRSGASVTLTLNGSPTTIFCAAEDTPIQWVVNDPNSTSFIDIRFGQNAYPFPQSSLQADSINSVAAPAGGAGCYQFAITDCPVAGGPCGVVDPKVVITPPGFLRHKGKIKHAPAQGQSMQH